MRNQQQQEEEEMGWGRLEVGVWVWEGARGGAWSLIRCVYTLSVPVCVEERRGEQADREEDEVGVNRFARHP